MSYVYLKGVCFMNFLKKSLSTILCCALTVNTLGLSSIIANATEGNSKEYVYDGYKINYDVTNSWGNTEVVSVTLSNTGVGYYCNKNQYFTPGTSNEASYAIKESNIYLNTEDKKYYIWENGAFVEYTEGDVA